MKPTNDQLNLTFNFIHHLYKQEQSNHETRPADSQVFGIHSFSVCVRLSRSEHTLTAELHCTKSCVFQIDIKIVNLLNKNRTSFKKMPEIMQYSFG